MLKGIAIVTVILVHVFRGKGKIDILIGEISRWAVPCFFMIQGYYMERTAQKPWVSNFVNKITKVYLPFVMFSTMYGLYFLKVREKEFTLTDVLLGETAVHLYFVIHYMIFATFIPLLYKLKESLRVNFIWFMMISNFIICLAYEIQKSYGIKLVFYSGLNPGKYWGFVALGMLVNERKSIFNYMRENPTRSIIVSAVVTLVGLLIPFITDTVGYMYNKSSLFPLAIGITSLIISYFYKNKVKDKNRLSYIGQRSFGVYLVHLFVIYFLKSIIGTESLGIVFILTLVVSILLVNMGRILMSQLNALVNERMRKQSEKELNI
nr:acyltransferase [Gottschalkia acidurici]